MIVLQAHQMDAVIASAKQALEQASQEPGPEPVIVCAPQLRQPVHRLFAAQVDGIPVLSYTEATAGGFAIDTIGVIRDTANEPRAEHAA